MTDSQRLWPIHPKPYEDELLSCWMVRIARAYGRRPAAFWKEVWGSLSFREIDRHAEESLLRLLSSKTGTPYERVTRATLRAYEAHTSTVSSDSKPPNRVGVSLYYRTWRGNTLRFCPACLAQDPVPYFRRSWCLAFGTLCIHHRIRLLDHCGPCGAPVRLERASPDAESLAVCYRCASELRSAPTSHVQAGRACDLVIQFQGRLLRLVEG